MGDTIDLAPIARQTSPETTADNPHGAKRGARKSNQHVIRWGNVLRLGVVVAIFAGVLVYAMRSHTTEGPMPTAVPQAAQPTSPAPTQPPPSLDQLTPTSQLMRVGVDVFGDQIASDQSSVAIMRDRYRESGVTISGWAIDEPHGSVPAGVIVTMDGQHFWAPCAASRPDVAKTFNNDLFTTSGFVVTLPIAAFTPGAHSVTLAVVSKVEPVYFLARSFAVTAT